MGSEVTSSLPPHVLIFPLPLQGHVNTMLKLAELLSVADIDVTFLLSEFSHGRLVKYANLESVSARYPGLQFQTIPDGLPDDHSRTGKGALDIIPAIREVSGPLFKKMMIDTNCFASAFKRPISCIIADGMLSFAGDFAEEKEIPLIFFRTVSASSVWACFNVPELIEASEIPIKGNVMDLLVKSVPGMEDFLRRRDLPEFCRVNDINDPFLHFIKSETQKNSRAQALILNTLEDLEGPILAHIRKRTPRLFTIGPTHALCKSRLESKKTNETTSILSGSFREQDRSCIAWLDSQPPKSVIYVSFGSITTITRDQLLEFWHGLVNSEQRYLWVMRPDSISGKDEENRVPSELIDATKERGYMVEWAPQEEVLNHSAVGGFLTHSGWNSTLECIIAGVPMICWPHLSDQTINSRFVSEIWKIGLDMKDTCDRTIIEKMVRDLMVVRKDEFLERAKDMANVANTAVKEGGSSYCNVDNLIKYIKSTIC